MGTKIKPRRTCSNSDGSTLWFRRFVLSACFATICIAPLIARITATSAAVCLAQIYFPIFTKQQGTRCTATARIARTTTAVVLFIVVAIATKFRIILAGGNLLHVFLSKCWPQLHQQSIQQFLGIVLGNEFAVQWGQMNTFTRDGVVHLMV